MSLSVSAPSMAQTAAPNPKREAVQNNADLARDLFKQGLALAKRGDWDRALVAFRSAYGVYPHAVTLFNIGTCQAETGDAVMGWYNTGRALSEGQFDPARRLNTARRALAAKQQATLEQRLATLHLPESQTALTLQIDGHSLLDANFIEPGVFIVAPPESLQATRAVRLPPGSRVYLNPGSYAVDLWQGQRLQRVRLELAAAERYGFGQQQEPARTVARASQSAERNAASPAASSVRNDLKDQVGTRAQVRSGQRQPSRNNAISARQSAAQPAPSVPVTDDSSALRTAGEVALVTSALGMGVALVAGVVALRTDRQLSSVCADDAGHSCPRNYSREVERYRTAAYLSNAGLAVGVGAGVTGLGLLWLENAQRQDAPKEHALSGIAISGEF